MRLGFVVPIVLGWLAGWLVNYLADVLPPTRRLAPPVCAHCAHSYPLAVYLAFVPCPNCGHRRGARPWLVQVAMLAVSVYTWLHPHAMGYWLGVVLLTYFLVVIVIDLEHRLILHPTSAVGAALALGIGLWVHGGRLGQWAEAARITLVGGLGGFGIMLALYYLGVLFSKLRARSMRARGLEADDEEALGSGDVILAGVLGLVLGWPIIWFGLLLGILLGGVVGIILLLIMLVRRAYFQQALMVFMPYGPYFVLSAFFILFLPNWIVGAIGR